MSCTFSVYKYYHAPTYFLVNTSIFALLDDINLFDHFISTKIPTPLCLLQIIIGSLEVCILTSILWIDKITLDRIKHTTLVLSPSHGIILTSIYFIDFFLIISSLTRTDFKYCYDETISS